MKKKTRNDLIITLLLLGFILSSGTLFILIAISIGATP